MQSWFAPVPDMVLAGTVLPGLQAQGRAAHDKSQRIRWRSSVRSPKSGTPFADGVGNCTLRFPDYWQNHDGDFNELIPMTGFQDVHASSTICVHASPPLLLLPLSVHLHLRPFLRSCARARHPLPCAGKKDEWQKLLKETYRCGSQFHVIDSASAWVVVVGMSTETALPRIEIQVVAKVVRQSG